VCLKAADANEDGKADKPVPMVLLVHGGPWGRDTWGYNPLHQLFANRGYATLSVNFRASTGFGKKFMNAGNLQWGKAMHDDLLDSVAWAVQQGVTAKDTVCITGGSYGGYATLAGLTMTPDAFRCGVDIVGPSNLMTLLATIPPYWAPLIAMFHTRMGNPDTAEGKALLEQASPLTHASKITKPLFVAQGKNDPRVPVGEAEQIVRTVRAGGTPVWYLLAKDEGHGFAKKSNRDAFLDEALHVGFAGPRGDVPVDRADVVAGDVRAHLVELHAASLEHGEIRSCHHVGDLTAGDELDALDRLGDFGGQHGDLYGTGTFSRICAMT
jgi:dipeptidyl aminopeptidase/acylaminoacyl peptidase